LIAIDVTKEMALNKVKEKNDITETKYSDREALLLLLFLFIACTVMHIRGVRKKTIRYSSIRGK